MSKLSSTLVFLFCLSLAPLHAEALQLWISSYQDKVYYEDMVKLYQGKNKNFKAEISAYGFQEMPDKLAAAIKTGVGIPDMVQLDEILFGIYLNGPSPFVDLASRVKASANLKGIHPSRQELFSYQGKQYGVAQSMSSVFLYYRKDILDSYGFNAGDLSTWDGFLEVGKIVRESNKGLLGLDPCYFEILLRQRGARLFDDKGKAFPDENIAIDTLEFLKDMMDKGIGVLPDRGSIFDPVFFNGDIANEEVFAVIGADWYGLDMIQNFSSEYEGQWAVIPLPQWNKDQVIGKTQRRTSAFAGQGLLITQASKHQDEAWKFIEFVMTDVKSNIQRFLGGNSFPAYTPVWSRQELIRPTNFFPHTSFGGMITSLADDMPVIKPHPGRPTITFLMNEQLFPAVMYGSIEASDALDKIREALAHPPQGK